MVIKSDDENMVLILGRYHLNESAYEKDLAEIVYCDVQFSQMVTVHNADVVIIKDGNEFAVLKHRHMGHGVYRQKYHKSSLTNIAFAR